MRCPHCGGLHLRISVTYETPIDGLGRAEKAVRRDRVCTDCNHLFVTYEVIAERLEALKESSKSLKKKTRQEEHMAGADEKKRVKLNNFLMQNSIRKFILEGTLVKRPHEISIDDIGREVDKFLARGGKMPEVKYRGALTFIIFDANKWVRVV